MESCRKAWMDSTIPLHDYFTSQLDEVREQLLTPDCGFDVTQQQFIMKSAILELTTSTTIKDIIGLIGIQPLVSFTTILLTSIKENLTIIISQLAELASTPDFKSEAISTSRSNMNQINQLVHQLKMIGRDDFLFHQLSIGISNYFKETNWTVDSVLSKLKTTDYFNSIESAFGMMSVQSISITTISRELIVYLNEWRETDVNTSVELSDLAFLLFRYLLLSPPTHHFAELFRGCRIVCAWLYNNLDVYFSDFLRELVQLLYKVLFNTVVLLIG